MLPGQKESHCCYAKRRSWRSRGSRWRHQCLALVLPESPSVTPMRASFCSISAASSVNWRWWSPWKSPSLCLHHLLGCATSPTRPGVPVQSTGYLLLHLQSSVTQVEGGWHRAYRFPQKSAWCNPGNILLVNTSLLACLSSYNCMVLALLVLGGLEAVRGLH